MHLIIETIKKTYVCESTKQDGTRTVLVNAVELGQDDAEDPKAVARTFVRATVAGLLKTVSVSEKNLESSEDAEQASPLIELMLKYVPLAERNAKVNAVLAEIDVLMGEEPDNN